VVQSGCISKKIEKGSLVDFLNVLKHKADFSILHRMSCESSKLKVGPSLLLSWVKFPRLFLARQILTKCLGISEGNVSVRNCSALQG
jgi:hypothetical protein